MGSHATVSRVWQLDCNIMSTPRPRTTRRTRSMPSALLSPSEVSQAPFGFRYSPMVMSHCGRHAGLDKHGHGLLLLCFRGWCASSVQCYSFYCCRCSFHLARAQNVLQLCRRTCDHDVWILLFSAATGYYACVTTCDVPVYSIGAAC